MEIIFRMKNNEGLTIDLISFDRTKDEDYEFDLAKLNSGIIVVECCNIRIHIATTPCTFIGINIRETATKKIYTLYGNFNKFIPKILNVENIK